MSRRELKLPLLRGRLAEVMLALRAGPMTADQLCERYGSTATADSLVRYALATRDVDRYSGNAYRLTDLGRKHCPSRRDLHATAEDFIESPRRGKSVQSEALA